MFVYIRHVLKQKEIKVDIKILVLKIYIPINYQQFPWKNQDHLDSYNSHGKAHDHCAVYNSHGKNQQPEFPFDQGFLTHSCSKYGYIHKYLYDLQID